MKKPKLNVFWAAIAGAGVVLVLIFALGVAPMVADQAKEQARLKKTVKDLDEATPGTPSQEDIQGWLNYRKELIRSYTDITKFYAASDQALERWLPKVVGDPPPRGQFMSELQDAQRHLEEKLRNEFKVVVETGEKDESGKPRPPGFNWEDFKLEMWDQILKSGAGEEQRVVKELQKRFWARQRVANLVIQSGVKVTRIIDFKFFKRLHKDIKDAPWEAQQQGKEAVHWQGVGTLSGGQSQQFQETLLPNDLGQTITFGFALELPYSEVPKAIREIVTPGTQAQNNEMLVNLVGTHITIQEQNQPMEEITYTKGDTAAREAAIAKVRENSKARDVILTVTCQIIDFDLSKVKTFAVK